jgi:hypothetical protein
LKNWVNARVDPTVQFANPLPIGGGFPVRKSCEIKILGRLNESEICPSSFIIRRCPMTVQRIQYEELLADYSSALGAIALLKQYRPYLELLPSMRRPEDSVISIPLPVVKFRQPVAVLGGGVSTGMSEALRLPCDIAVLMCDPEWKIKTGVEIFVFIHQPQEDFSDLLSRWRQTQVYLSQGYEWNMPLRYKHILSEGAESLYPLFVVFEETPDRIKRGLRGAFLPFVTQLLNSEVEEQPDRSIAEALWTDSHDDTLE